MSKKIVGFVPAKGSSSRVPDKNKQKILGVPLYLWAANNLSRVLRKKDIYIDSDDEEILKVSKSLGFNTIKRPSELANNSVDGNKLLEWEASNVKAEIYIQHLPPMIFCKKSTIESGIQAIKKENTDSVVYLHGEKRYPWANNAPEYDIDNIPNSFNLKETVSECMGLYIVNGDTFEKTRKRIGPNFSTLRIDHFENNDIDYEHDLIQSKAIAEYFHKNNLSEYISGIEEISEKIQ